MGTPIKEMTGQRFNRWLVIRLVGSIRGKVRWLCRCDCGTEKIVAGTDLRSGNSQSCRCYIRDRLFLVHTKHGQSLTSTHAATPEYVAWVSMINRCESPNYRGYARYGGRGITICERWRTSFTTFFEDMGLRPAKGMSLGRINNDGNYEPGNCEWQTAKQQALNRRNPWITRRQNSAVRHES